jgi:hypothetical protein
MVKSENCLKTIKFVDHPLVTEFKSLASKTDVKIRLLTVLAEAESWRQIEPDAAAVLR